LKIWYDGARVQTHRYQYSKCSTCRKALAYLDAQGASYESIDIVAKPPSRSQLAAALKQSGLPVKRFFNTSGQSYRDGQFGERLPVRGSRADRAVLARLRRRQACSVVGGQAGAARDRRHQARRATA